MFSEHGQFRLYAQGQIILFVAEGVWNLEASEHCIAEIEKLIRQLDTDEFGLIIDTTTVEGLTEESYRSWFDAIHYWLDHGLKATTRIDDPASFTYKVFLANFDKLLQSKMQFIFSDSVSDAIKWLNTLEFNGFENGELGEAITNQ